MFEVTRVLRYVYIASKYFYRVQYIHLILATLQSVVAAAANNLAV